MEQVRDELGKAPGAELLKQEILAAGLLRPAHLLDALRSFTVFMTTDDGVRIKAVPRHQQFRSVHLALSRLRHGKTRREDGMTDRRGGIVWHTQGSGKSLTMVFLVKKLRTIPELRRFKVVVVTDRTDLEDQLSRTAKLASQVMRVAKNADTAKIHLGRQEPDLVFVMIQKLQERDGAGDGRELVFASENESLPVAKTDEIRSGKMIARIGERPAFPVLNESEDVLVVVDEASPLPHERSAPEPAGRAPKRGAYRVHGDARRGEEQEEDTRNLRRVHRPLPPPRCGGRRRDRQDSL